IRGGIQLWDLRRIREQLRVLRLDWDPPADWPSLPVSPPSQGGDQREGAKPLQVEVDAGELLDGEKDSIILAFLPLHAEAYYRRGLAYARVNDWLQALDDFSRALALKPDHADASYQRGLAYARHDRFAQAVEDFSRSIELRPEHGEAYSDRAYAYFALGE